MKRLLIALVMMLSATQVAAQNHPRLRDAVRLLTEGQGDSARTLVADMLTQTGPSDSLYPEILFTAGIVAADFSAAQRDFERVAIEFDLSSWADHALLRLVQLHYAASEAPTALSWYGRLERDYPTSPVRAEAAFWGARAHFDLREEVQGCEALAAGLESVGEDIELRNRIEFYARRCTTLGQAEPESAGPTPSAYFAVQVLAASSVSAVDRVLTQLREAGYEASVTRDRDGLLKIRVGRYASRDQARSVAAEIQQRLGGEPFTVEVTP